MSTLKADVIKLVESLPDDTTIEDIQYHLYVREKVLRGSQAIDQGESLRMKMSAGESSNGPRHMD
jgi:hypothetical protein